MTKIFTSSQVRAIDKYSIDNEPVESIDLMERAAKELFLSIYDNIGFEDRKFVIVAGCGNNGGDGLAIARLLYQQAVDVEAYFCDFSENISNNCKVNLERLKNLCPKNIKILTKPNDLIIPENVIILDCLFGSGLSKPVGGKFAEIIHKINKSENTVIAIDIPSGLFGEDNSYNDGEIIEADYTFTIQFPPISSMFGENDKYYGKMFIVPIGLSHIAIENTETDYFIPDIDYIRQTVKKRKRFDHKGNFGHALLIAGKYCSAGAAVLASKSCIRSGVGLLTVHVPKNLVDILQISVPEAMIEKDQDDNIFTGTNLQSKCTAVGLGPGIGTDKETIIGLKKLLKNTDLPIVIDADGLNILSRIKNFMTLLKSGTILTPHPKEFERLFGKFDNSFQKMKFMQDFSFKTGVIIVLKGGISIISLPDKRIFFNTGGNPGMATGGSGDVLTGIITSFLAQSYKPEDAALVSVYVHSKSGDCAAEKYRQISMIASDIIECLPEVFKF
ncbi:MAG TPA: NAD(P)H-hydrate dehydratase [Bacteroidales bacterium]|nr:NAD(P)H-hydrate dehydratase [Bacteroidales bacterium]